MCVGTIVCGHKCVWAQTCVGTNVSGYKRVWAQSCGHSRVDPIMYGHNRGGTVIYHSMYNSCNLQYIGESDNLARRFQQHRTDLRTSNENNTIVKHGNN